MPSKGFAGLVQLLAGVAAAAVAGQASAAQAPRFAAIFSDHAVLQRDVNLPIWGEAEPGAALKVEIGGQTLETHADAKGDWRVEARPLKAGGPYVLKVSDQAGQAAELSDILAGDVWLCSGQSNMELRTGAATNAWNEIHASANPNLRFVNIERDAEPTRRDRLKQAVQWKVVGTDTTGDSSAVCYYMSKALQAAEKVPVGFIDAYWGGTPVQAWISEPVLRRMKRYDAGLDLLDRYAANPAATPPTPTPAASAAPPPTSAPAAPAAPPPWDPYNGRSVLYNGMIAPLAPYRLKGVAWYQGESNATVAEAPIYQSLLTALIGDWRRAFGEEELPFLVVQLPGFGAPATAPTQAAWPVLREAQRLAAQSTPGAGLAVTIDVGDRFDIHPTEKSVVGQRLALAARRVAYGETVNASPAPLRVERRGEDLAVVFADAGAGLRTYSSGQAIGFETCDAARACRFVEATAQGDTVVLKGANRPEVRFVRYAWADAPFVNLFNAADLPAAPFETPVP
jgi:sialate O-acetylesterase